MAKKPLIIGLGMAAVATAVLLSARSGDPETSTAVRRTASPTAPPRWPDYLFVTDGRRPRLYDVCDKEDAEVIIDTEEDRRNLGVHCRHPDAIRYVGYSAGYQPLYTPRQLEKAKAWFEAENRRYEESFFEPEGSDLFGTTTADANGCRSAGLRKVPKVADRIVATKADVDGDGKLDRITSYMVGDSAYGSAHSHLRVELGTGTVLDVEDPHYDLVIDSFYGASDFDRNGRSEVWIEPNTNKPGAVAILVFYSCELKLVQDGDQDFWIHTYGRIGETDGVECHGDRIVWTASTEHVKDPYGEGSRDQQESWFFREYRLRDASVVQVASGRGTDLDDRPSRFNWEQGLRCFDQ